MRRLFLLSMVALFLASCATPPPPPPPPEPPLPPRTVWKPWTSFGTPVPGPAQAIGEYSLGCLAGGVALPVTGDGYQAMRSSRKRLYAHPQLIAFINDLAQQVKISGLGDLAVGDLGQPRGGSIPGSHASHQSGLDADLWYLTLKEPLSIAEREKLSAPVRPSSTEALLVMAAQDERVDRIFVNPAVKRGLCEKVAGAPWLGKLRPWRGHDRHFHVRLHCPQGDALCVPQPPVEPGDGCDASLAWWFSDEARKPTPPTGKSQPRYLTRACGPVNDAP